MPRYLVSISSDSDIYGSIHTVDAPSAMDAFDEVVAERSGQGDIVILGEIEEIEKLARDRACEKSADFYTVGE